MGNLVCCVQVPQSQVAMKEGFGKFEKVLQPGCHCMPWFLGKRVAGHLSLRLLQLDIKCETKTKSSAVFIPHGPGAVRDVASQIRDGLLQGSISNQ
ncbi:hypothetical protein TSUD_208910 [Trifolium subterraneum]|uniref:Band 7 domain-containing protein n=1 Tax=Trifolium subterraneum TaxID=3900 RepID=A0A2Z6MSR5_TRISU|nr:hypothetical protein TSUD_208910 [Trifolium subterraneum]